MPTNARDENSGETLTTSRLETQEETIAQHVDIASTAISCTAGRVQLDEADGASDRLMPERTDDTALAGTPQSHLSPLESLPVEIHELLFLELHTLRDFRSLVHSSPRLHASYAQNRSALLSKFLKMSLGHIWFDAHYCHITGEEEFQRKRDNDPIWNSFLAYQDRLASPSTLFIQQQPLDKIVAMVRFHAKVIEPLSKRYAAWALAALHPTHDAMHPSMMPSRTEMLRIYRGLYRLQIYCNLFGHVPDKGYSTRSLIGGPSEHTRLLSHFPEWQVEEILCVYEFVLDKCDRVFQQAAWDLDEVHNPEATPIGLRLDSKMDLSHKIKREFRLLRK